MILKLTCIQNEIHNKINDILTFYLNETIKIARVFQNVCIDKSGTIQRT